MFAYRLVRANKGSPGVDGMTFEDIEQRRGIDTFLLELARDLKNKTCRPSPVRRVMISKADGGQRPLGIPTIRDRVAQMAVKRVIEPIFEADFCPNSYGFRPKQRARDATLTAALLDRLLHHARIVPIAGESYRLKHQCAAGMVKPKREKLLPA